MRKKTETIGFKCTPELRKALLQIAEKEDRSISYIINKVLEEYVKEQNINKTRNC